MKARRRAARTPCSNDPVQKPFTRACTIPSSAMNATTQTKRSAMALRPAPVRAGRPPEDSRADARKGRAGVRLRAMRSRPWTASGSHTHPARSGRETHPGQAQQRRQHGHGGPHPGGPAALSSLHHGVNVGARPRSHCAPSPRDHPAATQIPGHERLGAQACGPAGPGPWRSRGLVIGRTGTATWGACVSMLITIQLLVHLVQWGSGTCCWDLSDGRTDASALWWTNLCTRVPFWPSC